MNKILQRAGALALPLLLLATLSGHAQPLRFTIQLNKASYKTGEQVQCTLKITNTGNRNVVVNNRFLVNRPNGAHDIAFQLTGPGLTTVAFTSKIKASAQSDRYVLLRPGGSAFKNYDLSEDFDLLKPGKYELMGWYDNQFDPPAALKLGPAWRGNIPSNKTGFTILE
jgi:hypothetical protein